ncbi:MAG: PHP domain-containing protein [Anaerobutyricum sp.]
MKIVSRGFTEGFYYKPRVDYEVLEEYSEGIIALSACLARRDSNLYSEKDTMMKAKKTRLRLERIYLERTISFLELQDHGIP